MDKQISFGFKWVSISIFVSRISRFFTSIVLARLLLPEHFGIVALVNSIIEAIGIFRQVGFGAAFIYTQDENSEKKLTLENTTFYLSLVFNLAVFLASLLFAKSISQFFKNEELYVVLIAMFSTFILDGFITFPNVLLRKKLEFGKIGIAEIIESIAFAIIGITLALNNSKVWSLVFAHIGSRAIFGIIVIHYAKWRPRILFSFKTAKQLFNYGKYVWGFAAVGTIGKTIDKFIIGRMFGATQIGYYSIAYQLCTLPSILISFIIDKVTFPVLAKKQNDLKAIQRGFLTTLSITSLVCAPIAFGLFATSDLIILVIYGQKWAHAISMSKILVFYGFVFALCSTTAPVLKAKGKPNILFYTNLLQYLLFIVCAFLFKQHGTIGICYALLVSFILAFFVYFYQVKRLIELTFLDLVCPMLKSIVSSFGMYLSVKLFQNMIKMFFICHNALLLILSIMTGFLTYLFLSQLFNRNDLKLLLVSSVEVFKSKKIRPNN